MNTFIFDLDGTLLPMPDQKHFIDLYLKAVSDKMITCKIEPKNILNAILSGTQHMIKNDGSMSNEERFWIEFCRIAGDDKRDLENVFDDFYRNEFTQAKVATCAHPLAKQCIKRLKEKGYRVVLATNPLFPRTATQTRMLWAELDPNDFDWITTYEISSYCKPNLEYYKEVLTNIGKKPEECIMVGNDVVEDMCALQLGMDAFLLKDCLICPEDIDISNIKQGSFEDLYNMIEALPSI